MKMSCCILKDIRILNCLFRYNHWYQDNLVFSMFSHSLMQKCFLWVIFLKLMRISLHSMVKIMKIRYAIFGKYKYMILDIILNCSEKKIFGKA